MTCLVSLASLPSPMVVSHGIGSPEGVQTKQMGMVQHLLQTAGVPSVLEAQQQ